MDVMDEERERLFVNHRLQAVHGPPRYPEAERNPPPPPREYEPGFPFDIECLMDTRTGDWDSTQVVHNNMTWSAIWKTYHSHQHLNSAGITLVRLTDDKKAYRVKLSYQMNNVELGTLVTQKETVVFDSAHNSLHIRDGCTYASARDRNDGNGLNEDGSQRDHQSTNPPLLVMKITIYSVTPIDKFTYLDQKWPLAHAWLTYGNELGIRMRVNALMDMNPNFTRLKHDLGNKIMSLKEANAFYDFTSALFNRSFTGTDKYQLALRQGFKFGFSRNWELLDRNDSDLDFVSRTCLPLFPHLGEETNPPEEEQYFNNMRRVTAFGKFKLLNGNPFRRFFALKPQDVKTQFCQFYIYLETTASGETLLMSGGIFNCSNKEVAEQFLARVQVQFIIGNDVKLQFHAERIIHPKQRTINMVLGVMDAEHLSILESDRPQFFVSVCKLDTNVYHIGNYRYVTLQERTRKKESETRRQERKERRDRGEQDVEPDSEDEPEPPKDLVMPGVIDAWLISSDNKRIGVSRVYLSHHSEYFRTKLNENSFGDCGGDSAKVDEEEEIIWAVLQIIYHRSLLISPDNYARIATLGDLWLAPIVKRYVEMAMLQSDLIPPEEKREAANLFHFDVVKYILRHPEYAEDYNVVFPNGVNRVTADILDDEIDGGDGKRRIRPPGEPLLRPPPNIHAPPPQVPLAGAAQAPVARARFPHLGNLLEPFLGERNIIGGLPFMVDPVLGEQPGIFEQIDAQMRRREQEREQRARRENFIPRQRLRRGRFHRLLLGGPDDDDFEDNLDDDVVIIGEVNAEEVRQERQARDRWEPLPRPNRQERADNRNAIRDFHAARDRDAARAMEDGRQRNHAQLEEAARQRNENRQRARLRRLFVEDRERLDNLARNEPDEEVVIVHVDNDEEDARPRRRNRPGQNRDQPPRAENRRNRRWDWEVIEERVNGPRHPGEPLRRELRLRRGSPILNLEGLRRDGEPIVEFPPDDDHPRNRERRGEGRNAYQRHRRHS